MVCVTVIGCWMDVDGAAAFAQRITNDVTSVKKGRRGREKILRLTNKADIAALPSAHHWLPGVASAVENGRAQAARANSCGKHRDFHSRCKHGLEHTTPLAGDSSRGFSMSFLANITSLRRSERTVTAHPSSIRCRSQISSDARDTLHARTYMPRFPRALTIKQH
ncbi:hypothetical protein WMY93_021158 [Mugilogobius chulae]|uniref:Uncharacterized protein n=1 Tax=Mugilogobius chulae TaxID=88201 RepID=A0AAW0NM52_9GOBI